MHGLSDSWRQASPRHSALLWPSSYTCLDGRKQAVPPGALPAFLGKETLRFSGFLSKAQGKPQTCLKSVSDQHFDFTSHRIFSGTRQAAKEMSVWFSVAVLPLGSGKRAREEQSEAREGVGQKAELKPRP